MTKHEQHLIDQYNTSRFVHKVNYIKTMAEYNRAMLDIEIKNLKRKEND